MGGRVSFRALHLAAIVASVSLTAGCVTSGSTRRRVVTNAAIAAAGAAVLTMGAVKWKRHDDAPCPPEQHPCEVDLVELIFYGGLVTAGVVALAGGISGLVLAATDDPSTEEREVEPLPPEKDVTTSPGAACAAWRRSYDAAEDQEARDRLLTTRPAHCR